jgi:hypothetical protein
VEKEPKKVLKKKYRVRLEKYENEDKNEKIIKKGKNLPDPSGRRS